MESNDSEKQNEKRELEFLKKKFLKPKSWKDCNASDKETYDIGQKLAERQAKFPKNILAKEEEKKTGIERRLEDSDKVLTELIDLGNELVTNIKVANDKREILRRNYEAIKREELLADIQKESVAAMEKLNVIREKWTELEIIKEPMGLYEELELQKQRIADLMKQKDEVIRECQEEIKRADEKYYADLERQSSDISCIVERIDNQIEIIKKAYNEHLELLQETIENERKAMAAETSDKWEELHKQRLKDENIKVVVEKEKAAFYASEIDRISLEHQEITRATRIRLERDAETLQLELRNIKNNVLLNAEKLDYNYQVLQKRDEENIIIRKQQKCRLTELNETISNLKKKISETTYNSDAEIRRLKAQVSNVQRNVNDLEKKAENFSVLGEKKYLTVWELNLKEAGELLHKVLEIDRILHEQQLGLQWTPPPLPPMKMKDSELFKSLFKEASESRQNSDLELVKYDPKITSNDDNIESITRDQKRILKNILRKISDNAGFLIEEKLLDILKPYSDKQKMLVRIDNIFNALGINNGDDVRAMIEFFLPYSWCPNCSSSLCDTVKEQQRVIIDSDSECRTPSESSARETPKSLQSESDSNKMALVSFKGDKNSLNNTYEGGSSVRSSEKAETSDGEASIKATTEPKKCTNHYLVIEQAFVLTALRKYAQNHLSGQNISLKTRNASASFERLQKNKKTISRKLTHSDVDNFWSEFRTVFPEQKQKLWKSLQQGLNHYMKVLKQRETLDSECEFLRKQNAELKHLLQRYMPNDKCT